MSFSGWLSKRSQGALKSWGNRLVTLEADRLCWRKKEGGAVSGEIVLDSSGLTLNPAGCLQIEGPHHRTLLLRGPPDTLRALTEAVRRLGAPCVAATVSESSHSAPAAEGGRVAPSRGVEQAAEEALEVQRREADAARTEDAAQATAAAAASKLAEAEDRIRAAEEATEEATAAAGSKLAEAEDRIRAAEEATARVAEREAAVAVREAAAEAREADVAAREAAMLAPVSHKAPEADLLTGNAHTAEGEEDLTAEIVGRRKETDSPWLGDPLVSAGAPAYNDRIARARRARGEEDGARPPPSALPQPDGALAAAKAAQAAAVAVAAQSEARAADAEERAAAAVRSAGARAAAAEADAHSMGLNTAAAAVAARAAEARAEAAEAELAALRAEAGAARASASEATTARAAELRRAADLVAAEEAVRRAAAAKEADKRRAVSAAMDAAAWDAAAKEAAASQQQAAATPPVTPTPAREKLSTPHAFAIGARVLALATHDSDEGDDSARDGSDWVAGRVLGMRGGGAELQFKISLDGYDSETDSWVLASDPTVRAWDDGEDDAKSEGRVASRVLSEQRRAEARRNLQGKGEYM